MMSLYILAELRIQLYALRKGKDFFYESVLHGSVS